MVSQPLVQLGRIGEVPQVSEAGLLVQEGRLAQAVVLLRRGHQRSVADGQRGARGDQRHIGSRDGLGDGFAQRRIVVLVCEERVVGAAERCEGVDVLLQMLGRGVGHG